MLKWGRARLMAGGNFIVYSWFETEEECRQDCISRKEYLETKVNYIPVYLPDGIEEARK